MQERHHPQQNCVSQKRTHEHTLPSGGFPAGASTNAGRFEECARREEELSGCPTGESKEQQRRQVEKDGRGGGEAREQQRRQVEEDGRGWGEAREQQRRQVEEDGRGGGGVVWWGRRLYLPGG